MLERIEWILEQRGMKQRELARAAGLNDERHLGVILGRLRKNPEGALEHQTLVALARGGNVSIAWLATGEGSPDATGSEDPRPLYRNLEGWPEIEAQLRARGYDPVAVEVFGNGRALTTKPLTLEMAIQGMPLAVSSMTDEDHARAQSAIERRYKGAETRAAKKLDEASAKKGAKK
jgi:transcriptional regulator with XRE-family HTH domain